MIGCHVDYPIYCRDFVLDSLAETCSETKGYGEQEGHYVFCGAEKYSAEDLDSAARAYVAGARSDAFVTNLLPSRSERFGTEPTFLKTA